MSLQIPIELQGDDLRNKSFELVPGVVIQEFGSHPKKNPGTLPGALDQQTLTNQPARSEFEASVLAFFSRDQ
jgi:hypothetical protein